MRTRFSSRHSSIHLLLQGNTSPPSKISPMKILCNSHPPFPNHFHRGDVLWKHQSFGRPPCIWKDVYQKLETHPYLEENHPSNDMLLCFPMKLFPIPYLKKPLFRETEPFSSFNRESVHSKEEHDPAVAPSCALSDAFFDELRTKQQTGYTVKSWNKVKGEELMQYFCGSPPSPTTLQYSAAPF